MNFTTVFSQITTASIMCQDYYTNCSDIIEYYCSDDLLTVCCYSCNNIETITTPEGFVNSIKIFGPSFYLAYIFLFII